MTQQTTRPSAFSGSERYANPSVFAVPAPLRLRLRLEKADHTREAKRAIARYRDTREPAKAEALSNALRMIQRRARDDGSGNRLPVLLRLLESAPTDLFWRAFLELWPLCDNTWAHAPRLLAALRFHTRNESPRFLDDRGRTFLDGLPTVVTVYRGCSRVRIQGISWTTDETVARGYARGHRGLPVPDPVVVTAAIARQHIFAVSADRGESEILLDPAKLNRGSIRVTSAS